MQSENGGDDASHHSDEDMVIFSQKLLGTLQRIEKDVGEVKEQLKEHKKLMDNLFTVYAKLSDDFDFTTVIMQLGGLETHAKQILEELAEHKAISGKFPILTFFLIQENI